VDYGGVVGSGGAGGEGGEIVSREGGVSSLCVVNLSRSVCVGGISCVVTGAVCRIRELRFGGRGVFCWGVLRGFWSWGGGSDVRACVEGWGGLWWFEL